MTEDGSAARLVAKYRPPCPVIVVSPNARALRSLAVTFGLYPLQARARTRAQRAACTQTPSHAHRRKSALALALVPAR